MKELKFRVWDNVDYMSSSFNLQDVQEKKVQWTRDCVVMQYTVLNDKNGKEIFEGDIVEFDKNGIGDIPYDGYHKIRRTPVYWNDFRASWSVKFSEMANHDLFKYHLMCEVIGNIYENPELLS